MKVYNQECPIWPPRAALVAPAAGTRLRAQGLSHLFPFSSHLTPVLLGGVARGLSRTRERAEGASPPAPASRRCTRLLGRAGAIVGGAAPYTPDLGTGCALSAQSRTIAPGSWLRWRMTRIETSAGIHSVRPRIAVLAEPPSFGSRRQCRA